MLERKDKVVKGAHVSHNRSKPELVLRGVLVLRRMGIQPFINKLAAVADNPSFSNIMTATSTFRRLYEF